eukprot:Hpha_TRINITY_DN15166_c4_g10::TRINITY_DN15166_c4_g10_i1::g.130108::m.130108
MLLGRRPTHRRCGQNNSAATLTVRRPGRRRGVGVCAACCLLEAGELTLLLPLRVPRPPLAGLPAGTDDVLALEEVTDGRRACSGELGGGTIKGRREGGGVYFRCEVDGGGEGADDTDTGPGERRGGVEGIEHDRPAPPVPVRVHAKSLEQQHPRTGLAAVLPSDRLPLNRRHQHRRRGSRQSPGTRPLGQTAGAGDKAEGKGHGARGAAADVETAFDHFTEAALGALPLMQPQTTFTTPTGGDVLNLQAVLAHDADSVARLRKLLAQLVSTAAPVLKHHVRTRVGKIHPERTAPHDVTLRRGAQPAPVLFGSKAHHARAALLLGVCFQRPRHIKQLGAQPLVVLGPLCTRDRLGLGRGHVHGRVPVLHHGRGLAVPRVHLLLVHVNVTGHGLSGLSTGEYRRCGRIGRGELVRIQKRGHCGGGGGNGLRLRRRLSCRGSDTLLPRLRLLRRVDELAVLTVAARSVLDPQPARLARGVLYVRLLLLLLFAFFCFSAGLRRERTQELAAVHDGGDTDLLQATLTERAKLVHGGNLGGGEGVKVGFHTHLAQQLLQTHALETDLRTRRHYGLLFSCLLLGVLFFRLGVNNKVQK